MSSKLIAQMVMKGVLIFGKAAAQAYQQALNNARNPQAAAAAKQALRKRMNYSEALSVLNIEKSAVTPELVKEQYDKYYNKNDPAQGGSFYLQSKIFRAKESIDMELNGEKDEDDVEDVSGGGTEEKK